MKKNYLFSLALSLLVSMSLIGENLVVNGNFESWDNATTPTSWSVYDNISQESAIVYEGTYSAAQLSDASSQKLRQDVVNIVGGQQYTISYYYLDNTDAARTRIWSYWMQDGTYLDDNEEELRPSTYSEDNSEWQLYTVTITAPLTANEFRFDVRTYKQDDLTGGTIYFDDFTISGEIVVYPEPSNYPTEFAATAAGLGVNVTWIESVGDQLPTGYLVLGEKIITKAFDVPVDGIPVENDLDWSDNKVAVNVGAGTGAYLFDGLETNSSYMFTIYPYTNLGTDINYKTDGAAPEATATTANLTSINIEGFDADLATWSWTPYNVLGDQVWEWADQYGNPPGCAKMTGYDGGAFDNEDWLISPVLDLNAYLSVTFGFEQARNYATNDGLFVLISTDYDGTSDPSTTGTWADISDLYTWHEGGWDFIDAGAADISAYSSATTYIAFVFTSTTDGSATWELDNLKVLGVLNTGIANNSITKLNVYPNPATSSINIVSDNEGDVKIMSTTGQLIIDSKIVAGSNIINIQSLVTGLYIVETVDNNGQKSVAKLMVK